MTREEVILLHPDGPSGDRWAHVEAGLPAFYVPVRSKIAVGPVHQCHSCDCPPPSPEAVRLVRNESLNFPPVYGLADLFMKDWAGTVFDPAPRVMDVLRTGGAR